MISAAYSGEHETGAHRGSVIMLDHLSDAQERAYAITDNAPFKAVVPPQSDAPPPARGQKEIHLLMQREFSSSQTRS
jgi:hypothetical protein